MAGWTDGFEQMNIIFSMLSLILEPHPAIKKHFARFKGWCIFLFVQLLSRKIFALPFLQIKKVPQVVSLLKTVACLCKMSDFSKFLTMTVSKFDCIIYRKAENFCG
jgi:hypothetical protein